MVFIKKKNKRLAYKYSRTDLNDEKCIDTLLVSMGNVVEDIYVLSGTNYNSLDLGSDFDIVTDRKSSSENKIPKKCESMVFAHAWKIQIYQQTEKFKKWCPKSIGKIGNHELPAQEKYLMLKQVSDREEFPGSMEQVKW